jgi:hypothetical protein
MQQPSPRVPLLLGVVLLSPIRLSQTQVMQVMSLRVLPQQQPTQSSGSQQEEPEEGK